MMESLVGKLEAIKFISNKTPLAIVMQQVILKIVIMIVVTVIVVINVAMISIISLKNQSVKRENLIGWEKFYALSAIFNCAYFQLLCRQLLTVTC